MRKAACRRCAIHPRTERGFPLNWMKRPSNLSTLASKIDRRILMLRSSEHKHPHPEVGESAKVLLNGI